MAEQYDGGFSGDADGVIGEINNARPKRSRRSNRSATGSGPAEGGGGETAAGENRQQTVPPTRKRARKLNATELAGLQQSMAAAWAMVSIVLTAVRGPLWEFSEDELNQLGVATSQMLRHLPIPTQELGIAADVAMFGIVVMGVVSPRMAAEGAAQAVQEQTTVTETDRDTGETVIVQGPPRPLHPNMLTPRDGATANGDD